MSARPANFDKVARLYRWAEYLLLGSLLTRTREHFLPQISPATHALVLGDGDGRFLARLLRCSPHLQATAFDTSARMLHLLQKRCAFAGPRLRTVQASGLDLAQAPHLRKTDLIATHFFLDCLHQGEVDALASKLAQAVQPGCLWVVSEFGIPQRAPWRILGHAYVRALYLAFRLLTRLSPQRLPAIAPALLSAGFCRIDQKARLGGLLYSELWRLGAPLGPQAAAAAQLVASPRPSTQQ